MAYYLGRDVKVMICTENVDRGISLDGSNELQITAVEAAGNFANELTASGGGTAFALGDLNGVDLSIGTVDEDITYMGQRSVLKAEIKKETTITLTMKKTDSRWDLAFNGTGSNSGRYGIKEGGASFQSGLEDPGVADFGYRLYIKLNSGEYFMAPNCCLQGHTVTLNSDGTTEETLEFMTYLDPIIQSTVSVADAGAF